MAMEIIEKSHASWRGWAVGHKQEMTESLTAMESELRRLLDRLNETDPNQFAAWSVARAAAAAYQDATWEGIVGERETRIAEQLTTIDSLVAIIQAQASRLHELTKGDDA